MTVTFAVVIPDRFLDELVTIVGAGIPYISTHSTCRNREVVNRAAMKIGCGIVRAVSARKWGRKLATYPLSRSSTADDN